MLDNERRWRNRRRMAWIAFLAGVVYPFVAGFEWVSADIASPFYMFVTGVVGCYMGFSTWDDVRNK